LLTRVMLPGGGKLGIYQPRHPRPAATSEEAPKGQNPTSSGPGAEELLKLLRSV
jgi:hypothetical protein